VIPHSAVIAIVLLVSAGCQRDEPRAPAAASPSPSPSTAAGAVPAPLAQDTGFAGTTAPMSRVRARAPYGVLRRVETAASGAGYDRVVFEFTGDSVPGYSIQYTTAPVQSCGSGDPVSVAGTQRLVVRLEPARAHDEQGNAAPIDRQLAPRLPAVKEMKLVCDFEGQVEWVLGLAARAPYRVSELAGPARLVLDVRHQP